MGIGLKTVPKLVSPGLLKLMGEMRQGEQIVFADRSFPSATLCSRIGGPMEIKVDGHSVAELLKASLQYFPLDHRTGDTVILIRPPNGHQEHHILYKKIIQETSTEIGDNKVMDVDLLKFLEKASKAHVVHTDDTNHFASILLTKGTP